MMNIFHEKQSPDETVMVDEYCENKIINATVRYCVELAEKHHITTEISLDIPTSIPIDSFELARVLAELMKNAIRSCKALEHGRERYIRVTIRKLRQLVIEISNSCDASVALDEYGHLYAKKKGLSSGAKSILAFEKKYDAQVMWLIADGVFWVRLII